MSRFLVYFAFIAACSRGGITPEQEQAIAERVRLQLQPELDSLRNEVRRAPAPQATDSRLDRVAQVVDDAARCVAGGDDTNACVRRALAKNAGPGSSPAELAQDKVKGLEEELAALDKHLAAATAASSTAEIEQLRGERARLETKITAAKADVERAKKDKKRCDDNPRATGC